MVQGTEIFYPKVLFISRCDTVLKHHTKLPTTSKRTSASLQHVCIRLPCHSNEMRLHVATCLLFKAHSRRKRQHVASRNRHEHRNTLSLEAFAIRQRRIPRISLTSVKNSPWRKIFHSGNNQAMITLTGFTCEAFEYVLEKFSPVYHEFTPFVDLRGFIIRKISKAGRPRLMKAHDCLGLYLAWTRTRGSLMVLQLLFGVT